MGERARNAGLFLALFTFVLNIMNEFTGVLSRMNTGSAIITMGMAIVLVIWGSKNDH